jgi:hypothetical protein
MPFNIRAGGAWKPASGARVRVGGAWKTVERINVRVGGAWKVAYTNTITPGITATASPNPSFFTQDVTISGTITPVPTGGTVLIRDSFTNPIGTAVNVNTSTGAYSVTIPDQGVGSYTFTANYSGYDIYQPVFTSVSLAVGVIPTTTTITRSAASYAFNETRITLSGTVSPVPTSGTVTVSASSPSVTLGNVGVDPATGAWSLIVPVRSVGAVSGISATYGGFGDYASSTSGTTSYSVTQATTSLTASRSSASVQAGNTVTLSASLLTGSTNSALSGKTITFQGLNASSAWVNLGSGTTNASGLASFVWTAVAGYTQIRAVYAGETDYVAVTSAGVAITVTTTIATTTSIARDVSTYAYNGTRVTISGTVSPAPSGGTITIRGSINGAAATSFATSIAVNTTTGAYSAVMPVQDAGSYTSVTATYSGSGLYLSSESGTTSYSVTQAATTFNIGTTAFDVTEGTVVTLSAELYTGGAAFSGQTVTFQVRNGSTLAWVNAGSDATNTNGDASITWTTNNAYDQSRAVYTATTNYAGATSTGVDFTTRVRTTTSISTATTSSNWYYRGSIASAQQVGTNITFPAAVANAIGYNVYQIAIAVSGINGSSGYVQAAVWTSGGSLVGVGNVKTPASQADGSTSRQTWTAAQLPNIPYTPNTVYKVGFWRKGNSTTYQTQWRQNGGTGRNTYWDNSAASAGTFTNNTTFSADSLDLTVYFEYYVKNN